MCFPNGLLIFKIAGERPFKCNVPGCDRSFTTSNIRKVHVRTHTGERPYECTEPGCGRAFASATNFKNHMRIHSGEKPYMCNVKVTSSFCLFLIFFSFHLLNDSVHSPFLCSFRCAGEDLRSTRHCINIKLFIRSKSLMNVENVDVIIANLQHSQCTAGLPMVSFRQLMGLKLF